MAAIRSGRSVGGPQTTTFAPIFVSSQMLDRTTREWAMSPQIATRRPSRRPSRWRMVSASSRAWVGCSCAPSPALTTPAFRWRARKCGTPGEPWRITIRSGDMAWRFLRRIEQGLALLDRAPLGREVERVGGEPLLGRLEGEARPRRRLEEEIDDHPAAQGRDLLDGTLADRAHRLGRVEEKRDLVGRQRLDPEQVLGAQAGGRQAGLSRIQTSSARSVSSKSTWMTSRFEVGTLLPT